MARASANLAGRQRPCHRSFRGVLCVLTEPLDLDARIRRLHRERVDLAPLVERAEFSRDDADLAVVLDPDLPLRGLGDAAEATPVDDEPLVFAGRPWALH